MVLRSGCKMERRKAVRFGLTFPVLFKWREGRQNERQGGGFSRDVSSGGIYVECESCPPVNATICLEVLVPSPSARPLALRLKAEGEVVRLHKLAKRGGFGASAGFKLTRSPSPREE